MAASTRGSVADSRQLIVCVIVGQGTYHGRRSEQRWRRPNERIPWQALHLKRRIVKESFKHHDTNCDLPRATLGAKIAASLRTAG